MRGIGEEIVRVLRMGGLVAVVVAGLACMAGRPPAVRLYDPATGPPGRDEVATLYGPIGAVDGRDVSGQGNAFELLPGCHVVTLRSKVGGTNSGTTGAWTATLGGTFAFRMQAAHTYAIDLRAIGDATMSGEVRIDAWDSEAGGDKRPVPPARGTADIDACRAWAQMRGY
jgi:hypothetical protein